jgi:hypothetical protein
MPSANFAATLSVTMVSIRAAPWAELVRIGTCQPCQLRAGTPISCRVSAISPAVTFSPAATTASYSRASNSGDTSCTQPTSSLVRPAMAETATITRWPRATSSPTRLAARRMRSTDATEVPPNFITRIDMPAPFAKPAPV